MASRLSRSERRNLERQDAEILGRPLVMGTDPRPAAAHVRHIVRLLRDAKSVSPCSEAVAHLTALFDRTYTAQTSPKTPALACRKGCAHCCTQLVLVTAPEAFFVAAQLRKRPETIAAIHEANTRTQGHSIDGRLKDKIPCALLSDAICSVYAARPLG